MALIAHPIEVGPLLRYRSIQTNSSPPACSTTVRAHPPELREKQDPGLEEGRVLLIASSEARRPVDHSPPQPTGPEGLGFPRMRIDANLRHSPLRGPAFMPREVSRPHPAGPRSSPRAGKQTRSPKRLFVAELHR